MESPHRCRESAEELRENDENFTAQIRSLFNTLHALEERVGIGSFQLTIYVPERENYGCLHRKFSSWRLRLLSPDSLPEVLSVKSLTIKPVNPYLNPLIHDPSPEEQELSLPKLNLCVLIDLAIKLPQLRILACELGYHEWAQMVCGNIEDDYNDDAWRSYSRDFPGPRRDTRHELARLLPTAALPRSLRRVQLGFLTPLMSSYEAPQDEQLPDLVAPYSYDPFSSSLRVLSCRLRHMELKGVFDKTLFWPVDGSTPAWPLLDTLNVYLHIGSPSGRWNFYGPKGEGRTVLAKISRKHRIRLWRTHPRTMLWTSTSKMSTLGKIA